MSIDRIFIMFGIICILLIAILFVSALRKHESPVVAAKEVEQAVVVEAKRGETVAADLVHKLDANLLGKVHDAEVYAGRLAKGTTQALVDAHIENVKASTAALNATTVAADVVPAGALVVRSDTTNA